MAATAPFDPDQVISDGLTNFGEAMGDPQVATAGAALYQSVADAFRGHLTADDVCLFAFPSVLMRGSSRPQCLVAVLTSRVLVGWRQGVLRKSTKIEDLPRAETIRASLAAGQTASTRGTTLLTITGRTSVTVALPKGRNVVAQRILAAVRAGSVTTRGPEA